MDATRYLTNVTIHVTEMNLVILLNVKDVKDIKDLKG